MKSIQIKRGVSAIALAFIVIMSSCGTTSTPVTQKNGTQLFNENFKPYSDEGATLRSLAENEDASSSEAKEALAKGMSAYSSKNFKEAIIYFESYLGKRPDNLQVPFFLGISHIGVSELPKAENQFNKLLKQPTSLYFEHSQWFMALIEMNKGNYSKSQEILETILKARDHYYHEQAEGLIDQVTYLKEHGDK